MTKDMTDEDKTDFMRRMGEVLDFGIGTKRLLLDRGKTRGRRTCPFCGGTVRAALAGPRNHLHMACETQGCNMRMME